MSTSASWTLLPDAPSPAPVPETQTTPERAFRVTAQEFLGFGILRPFQRSAADFAAAGGELLVKSAVGQILGTMGASDFTQGEIPWRTSFGSQLHLLRNQKNTDALQELARVYVVDALQRWEPRVIVKSVQAARQTQDGENVLSLRVRYDLISANTPGNQVLLEGLEQVVRVL